MSIAKFTQLEIINIQHFVPDNMSEGVFLIDENTQFQYVNQAACNHLGYTKEELLTMGIFDIDPLISRDEVRKFQQNNRVQNILHETQHKTKNGKIVPVEINSSFFNYNGIHYVMSFIKDITERKLMTL